MKTTIKDFPKYLGTAALACCLALAALALTAPGGYAQGNSWNPYLIQGIIDRTGTSIGATLQPVEFNGTGVARFDVGNTGSSAMPAAPGDLMTLVITLSKGVPNNADPLAALGGPGVEWFNWQYFPDIRTYYAIQNQTIPGDSRRTVTIAYKVMENSFLGSSPTVSNGFNVNLQPPGYTNPQPTDDDSVSSYTYVEAFDYGDAPISYGDVRHTVDVVKNLESDTYNRYIFLGNYVDPEYAYQASAAAKGDDNNQTGGLGVDDEDGVTFPNLRRGETVTIPVVVTIADEGSETVTPRLSAWIDWNGNGTFEAGERIATNVIVAGSGTVNLSVTVPADAVTDRVTFARFRIGPSVTGPTGNAAFGEVEDYEIQILVPSAVLLADFAAASQPDHVLVTWQTFSEFDNAGFNLYRALAVDGERTLLGWTPSAAPGSTAGAAYSYQDFDVVAGQTYWYWLEDVDLLGVATLHGPVNAVQGGMLTPRLFLPLIMK